GFLQEIERYYNRSNCLPKTEAVNPAMTMTRVRLTFSRPERRGLLDTVKIRFRPQDQRVVCDGGRGHETVVEFALAEFFEFASGSQHGGFAFLVEEVNASAREQRRRRAIAADAFAPNL